MEKIAQEDLIQEIKKLSKSSLIDLNKISFIFNKENLSIMFKNLNRLGETNIELDENVNTLSDEENIKIINNLNKNLYELIKILKFVNTKADNQLSVVITNIAGLMRELCIILMQYKKRESRTEATNRLEYAKHYEKIIEDDENLKNLYTELKEYFGNKLAERNLTKKNIDLKKEYFFHDEENVPTNHDNEESFHIIFQINKNCNFKCTYCYEGLDKVTEILNINDIPKIVQGIKEFGDELKNRGMVNKFSFSMLGGEPTIVPSRITQLLTKTLNDELDLKYIILITNNYSAKRTIDFFHPDFPKDKIKVQISYDGGKIQDDYRKDFKRNGTKELLTKETYKLLKESKDIKVTMKATLPIDAIGSISDAVMDYITFEDDINAKNGDINSGNFSYYPTFDTTSILMYNLRQQIKYGDEEQKEKLFKDIDDAFKFLLKFELDRLLNGKKVFTRWFRELSYTSNEVTCSAGNQLFGLDQLGNGRFCHRTEFGEEHTNIKYPYKKEQLDSLNYGKIDSEKFNKNFFETREKLLQIQEDEDKSYSYCENCKTLTCVKCPMINVTPDRNLDTSTTGNMYKDMYSHGINLSCEINNQISKYLYIFDKIINLNYKEK